MLTVCWSPKGGSGTSVVAGALALQTAAAGHECLLVDLDGDQPAILGLPTSSDHGLTDWLAAPEGVPVDALRALETPVTDRLQLLPRGGGEVRSGAVSGRLELAAMLLEASSTSVVVDAGSGSGIQRWWPPSATTVTVVRACYLALRRLSAGQKSTGDSLVLIEEAGRALSRRDVGAALCDIVVELDWDPSVARAVDAGLLAHRMPRSLRRLRSLMPPRSAGAPR